MIERRVGDEVSMAFCKDHCISDCPLMVRFPILFLLEGEQDFCIAHR